MTKVTKNVSSKLYDTENSRLDDKLGRSRWDRSFLTTSSWSTVFANSIIYISGTWLGINKKSYSLILAHHCHHHSLDLHHRSRSLECTWLGHHCKTDHHHSILNQLKIQDSILNYISTGPISKLFDFSLMSRLNKNQVCYFHSFGVVLASKGTN